MTTGKKIICSRCDYVVAIAPESRLLDAELICPNCGTKLRPAGALEETIDKLKDFITGSNEKNSS